MRPRSQALGIANRMYTPKFPRKYPAPVVPQTKWAFGVDDSLPCHTCGWALSVAGGSPLYAGKTEAGERLFKHYACPTLSERRELRKAALVNA